MWILIIGLIVLTAIAMAVGYARNKKIQKKIESGELQAAPEIVEADAECCGQHEICEKESLLAAVSKKVEYYDDEELDRFRGHSSDGYSEEEIEEFREVMVYLQGRRKWRDGAAVYSFGVSNCRTN